MTVISIPVRNTTPVQVAVVHQFDFGGPEGGPSGRGGDGVIIIHYLTAEW